MGKGIIDYSSMDEVKSFRLNSDVALAYLREHTPFVGNLITSFKGELDPKDEFNLRFRYYSNSLETTWKKHGDGLSLDAYSDMVICNYIYSVQDNKVEEFRSLK